MHGDCDQVPPGSLLPGTSRTRRRVGSIHTALVIWLVYTSSARNCAMYMAGLPPSRGPVGCHCPSPARAGETTSGTGAGLARLTTVEPELLDPCREVGSWLRAAGWP